MGMKFTLAWKNFCSDEDCVCQGGTFVILDEPKQTVQEEDDFYGDFENYYELREHLISTSI